MTTDEIDKKKYVSREVELELFREMLKDRFGDKRIMFILGDGGIGKTYLIRELLEEAKKQGYLAPDEPIDFFSTDYRHIDGIQSRLKGIVDNLAASKGKTSPFADWISGETDTSEKFYEYLKKFCGENPLVLAFDTFENLDKVASDWLFKGEPDGLQSPGLICVMAGRVEEKADIDDYRNNPLVKEAYISGFTHEQTEDFYQKIVEDNKVRNNET
ncbi:MAG: ATP-binding protein, partial [Chloroflexi bacterium]